MLCGSCGGEAERSVELPSLKFDILAEKAKKAEDAKMQELKNVKLSTGSQRGRRSGFWVARSKNYLKALSSATGGRKRTSSTGPSSSNPTSTQSRSQSTWYATSERLLCS